MAESLQPVIEGDPTIALIAQINRFRMSPRLATPRPELPLFPSVTREIAIDAITLLQARTLAAIDDPTASDVMNELNTALGNPIAYVAPRVTMISQALALFGDSLGLPAAKVGITKRDPRFRPKWDAWMWISVVGALGIATVAATFAAHRVSRRAA